LADKEGVENMALPDAIAFTRADEATLNAGSLKEIGIGADSSLFLWEVASYQLIERWFHVKQA
jgi:hypothetical protein